MIQERASAPLMTGGHSFCNLGGAIGVPLRSEVSAQRIPSRRYLGEIAASILLGPKISAEAMLKDWSFPNNCSTTYS